MSAHHLYTVLSLLLTATLQHCCLQVAPTYNHTRGWLEHKGVNNISRNIKSKIKQYHSKEGDRASTGLPSQMLWKIPQNFVDNWYTAIIWYTAPQCPMECHSVMWNSGPEVRERSGNCPSHFHLLHFTFTLHSTPPLLRPQTLSELWGQQTKYDAAQYNTSYNKYSKQSTRLIWKFQRGHRRKLVWLKAATNTDIYIIYSTHLNVG